MEAIAVIGIDLAKSVFQVHGVDAQGQVMVRKRLNRAKLLPFFDKLSPCLIGMETCASANYWARELIALGHEVRLMRRRPLSSGVSPPTLNELGATCRAFIVP